MQPDPDMNLGARRLSGRGRAVLLAIWLLGTGSAFGQSPAMPPALVARQPPPHTLQFTPAPASDLERRLLFLEQQLAQQRPVRVLRIRQ